MLLKVGVYTVNATCFILYSKAKPACYSEYLLTSYFCIPVPYDKKDIFFWVLVLEGTVGLHRPIQLHLLWHYCWGHWLGLLWFWMFCLGEEPQSLGHFLDCTLVVHFRLLLTMKATPFLLRDSCPQWSELNSSIQVHFISLVPKMLICTLAVSYLTTCNLPWFMDLTFQVPM